MVVVVDEVVDPVVVDVDEVDVKTGFAFSMNSQSRNMIQQSMKTTTHIRVTHVHQWHLHVNGLPGLAP